MNRELAPTSAQLTYSSARSLRDDVYRQIFKFDTPVRKKIRSLQLPACTYLNSAKSQDGTRKNMSGYRRVFEEYLPLLVTPIWYKRSFVTVVQRVVLTAMNETAVLVNTQATASIELMFHEKSSENYAWMTTKGIMDVYPGHFFYITIASFDKIYENQPEHQNVGDVTNERQEIAHNKDECF